MILSLAQAGQTEFGLQPFQNLTVRLGGLIPPMQAARLRGAGKGNFYEMKPEARNASKELYQRLRGLPWERLWAEDVGRFNAATGPERLAKVAVVRAVGVVFAESGDRAQAAEVREWLRGLLQDPCEKIRRYAMTAMPKIGAGAGEEAELLALMRKTEAAREKKFLGRTLEKIGGAATLESLADVKGLPPGTEQKVRASVVRSHSPSVIRMDRALGEFAGLRIHLRGRRGLERIVREEAEEHIRREGKFRLVEASSGRVSLAPVAPFTLADVYAMRCFDTLGLVVSNVPASTERVAVDALAMAITSPLSRRVLGAFTDGPVRYRLDFVAKGHQRAAVRELANRVYARCPELLNDARNAPWTVAIFPAVRSDTVELCPKLTPDPRLYYRQGDVPASSHPPLAACMARLAGPGEDEVVWDPFCGSGLELIERALRGGVRSIRGTDLSPEAVEIARKNVAAAKLTGVAAEIACGDFREVARGAGMGPGSVSLVITNPPMGRRVPVPNLRGLIEDLFAVSAVVLRPGGRLVFANPLRLAPADPTLKLQSRRTVDLGGFECLLEVYVKQGR